MAEKNIGELPELTELDDLDQLVARSVGDVVTGRISIATLRAAMGGGSPDRIESASGEAFVEASEFNGSPRTIARSGVGMGYAIQSTFSDGDKSSSELIVKGAGSPSAGIRAEFDEGVYTLSAHGAPFEVEAPTEDNHAATKQYVDAIPSGDKWSKHAATEDVDMDGHRITSLGAPVGQGDAATKKYVDDAVAGGGGGGIPSRIESPSGGSYVESSDNFMGMGRAGSAMMTQGHNGLSAVYAASYPNEGDPDDVVYMAAMGVTPDSASGGPQFMVAYRPVLDRYSLKATGAPLEIEEPTEGQHAATKAYVDDAQRTLVEWWEPTWTAVANVDDVTNIECQYTRVHRAAGGSLVTLEGTIEVESLGAGQCGVTVPVPVPVAGSPIAMGVAAMHKDAETSQATAILMSGDLQIGFSADDVYGHIVSFRVSYRAA